MVIRLFVMQGNANITNLDLMAIESIINKILFVTCYKATNGEEEKKIQNLQNKRAIHNTLPDLPSCRREGEHFIFGNGDPADRGTVNTSS